MPDRFNSVLHAIAAIDEEQFKHAFVAGLHRLVGIHGRAKVANALGCTDRNLNNYYTGSLPSPHRLWNLRSLDLTALDEIAGLYSAEVRQSDAAAVRDFETIANLSRLAADYVEVMADGVRDHRETLDLAETIRPLMASLSALVAEADRIKRPN